MKRNFFPSSAPSSVSLFLVLSMFLFSSVTVAQTPFVQDSAFSYLKVIAGTIGPRPMGSPNERAAMEYAVAKLREFGCQETFIMPMRATVSAQLGGGVNTNSGIAVGVLRGTSKRTIVIGGHIDSAGPEIPGANDDGSGAATVLELARVLGQRTNESTIVFALFGGEEQGMRGSWYFAKNFDRMDDVALMLQIDMTNGSDWLLPLVRSNNHMSPEWLVKASYEEFEAAGYKGLYYPTHFSSFLEAAPGGGIGSDYEPFLEHGIAAIDFTSDVNDPIHTPQDNLENFIPSGLKRSGDLVYRLVERFDAGVPEETSGSYYLVQIGTLLFFFPPWSLWAFIVLAIGLGVFTILRMRKRRVAEEPRQKIPGLKMFLIILIIQTFVWMSETVVGLIKGDRFPWLSSYEGYFILGFLAALLGIWISMRLAPHLGLSRNPYRYALRAIAFLTVYTILMALRSPFLGLYGATGLFLIALSFLVEQWYLKFIFWLVSPHFLFRMIFSDGYGLMARSMAYAPIEGSMVPFLVTVAYVLIFALFSFPFLLAFAAIRFETPEHFVLLSRLKTVKGGIVLAAAFVVWTVYLSLQPTYSKSWKQLITVNERVDGNTMTGSAAVWSMDYLNGAHLRNAGRDTVLTSHDRRVELGQFTVDEPWIQAERTVETTAGTNTTFNILLTLKMKYRPYKLTVRYAGGKSTPEEVSTPLVWSPGTNSISLNWYSFPDSVLIIPISLEAIQADSLVESIEATFVQQASPVEISRGQADVMSRTTLVQEAVLRKP